LKSERRSIKRSAESTIDASDRLSGVDRMGELFTRESDDGLPLKISRMKIEDGTYFLELLSMSQRGRSRLKTLTTILIDRGVVQNSKLWG
jgi:hypothetical protein